MLATPPPLSYLSVLSVCLWYVAIKVISIYLSIYLYLKRNADENLIMESVMII